jgi:predicted negative regulator of RcsB-dependent stress response
MATLEPGDGNIFDEEPMNWRPLVYSTVGAAILLLGAFSYYYYLQNQREELEAQAHEAFRRATTPEELVQVADRFARTDHATMALLRAAEESFSKQDYGAAIKDYQRIIDTVGTDPLLSNSAQIGLAASLEASGKIDDAIKTYLELARLGDKTPYAPYAYTATADLYDERGDKSNERKILTEATSLSPDSPFVKKAQFRLKELNADAPQIVPAPNTTTTGPVTNAAAAVGKP